MAEYAEVVVWLDLLVKICGVISLVVAALTLHRSASVRREDLTWRMASAAREALSDIHKNPYAVEAVHIVDSVRWQGTYSSPKTLADLRDIRTELLEAVFAQGPRGAVAGLTEDQLVFVRRCFDWLLYYIDRVAYQAKVGMLQDHDFATPLVPYATFIAERPRFFHDLSTQEHYLYAPELITKLTASSTPRKPKGQRA